MKKIVALLMAIVMVVFLAGCAGMDYKKAIEAYEQGNYDEAKAMFAELGDYEDSTYYVLACDYAIACGLMENGDYEAAIGMFEQLGDHEDSAAKIEECNYSIAKGLMDAGNHAEASEYFIKAGNYADTAELKAQCGWKLVYDFVNNNGGNVLFDISGTKGITIINESAVCLWYYETKAVLTMSMMNSMNVNIDINEGGVSMSRTSYVGGSSPLETTELATIIPAEYTGEATGAVDMVDYSEAFETPGLDWFAYTATNGLTQPTDAYRSFDVQTINSLLSGLNGIITASGFAGDVTDLGFTALNIEL